MRRPYIVVKANPAKLTNANAAGAKVLADYMTSDQGRAFLADFAAKQPEGFPLFYAADTASPFPAPFVRP